MLAGHSMKQAAASWRGGSHKKSHKKSRRSRKSRKSSHHSIGTHSHKKKKRTRKLSKYNIHVRSVLKRGGTMKSAAKSWRGGS